MSKFELKSEFVQKELDKRQLSQRDLAKLIGTSQALVNYWITAKSPAGAVRIAEALKLNAKDLIRTRIASWHETTMPRLPTRSPVQRATVFYERWHKRLSFKKTNAFPFTGGRRFFAGRQSSAEQPYPIRRFWSFHPIEYDIQVCSGLSSILSIDTSDIVLWETVYPSWPSSMSSPFLSPSRRYWVT